MSEPKSNMMGMLSYFLILELVVVIGFAFAFLGTPIWAILLVVFGVLVFFLLCFVTFSK